MSPAITAGSRHSFRAADSSVDRASAMKHDLPNGTPSTPADAPFYWDESLLLVVTALLGLGVVAMGSAAVADPAGATFYLQRQLLFLAVGLVAALIATRLPLALWQRLALPGVIAALLMLIVVLLPGVGETVNGSTRWIGVGPLRVQVAEPAKLLIVIYLAAWAVRHGEQLRSSLAAYTVPYALFPVASALLLLQPDFGTAAVITAAGLLMLFLAGARLRFLALPVLLAVIGFTLLAITSPYRWTRLVTFLDPWADPLGSGYQLVQSLIAIGRGGLFGEGLGEGVQKLQYLPEAHTDFLFAVLAEELGLIGVAVLILLYLALLHRLFAIGVSALRLDRRFGAYLVFGIALIIGFQAWINIGVNLGLLPTKGLTLPLMSYGGSSLAVMLLGIGLALRVQHENRYAVRHVRSAKARGATPPGQNR